MLAQPTGILLVRQAPQETGRGIRNVGFSYIRAEPACKADRSSVVCRSEGMDPKGASNAQILNCMPKDFRATEALER